MESRKYPTDLSDDEWDHVGPHLSEPKRRGRPRLHGSRAILDAVFYVLKSGCPWRMLPRGSPPWETVYDWFRKWRIDGTFERSTLSYESALGLVREGTLNLARASLTPSPPRRPASAGSRGASTEASR